MTTITNAFDPKDEQRIADMVRKSKGNQNRLEVLARRMAETITKPDKALRRANAADNARQKRVAEIFMLRYHSLRASILDTITTSPEPEPPMEVDIESVTFREKEKPSAKPRIYFWKTGVIELGEMFGQRYTPKALFMPHMDTVLKPLGMSTKETKVRWSQYAGCTCPCSPGFIIDNSAYGFDIHVNYSLKTAKKAKAS